MLGLTVDFERLKKRLQLNTLITYFKRANLNTVGPTITYYTLLSLVPVLMTVGSIAGLAGFNISEITNLLESNLPSNVVSVLIPILKSVLSGSVGVLSFSLIVTIWGASRVIAIIRKSFNKVHDVPEKISGLLTRVFSFLWLLVLLGVVASLLAVVSLAPVILDALPFDIPWLATVIQSGIFISNVVLLALLVVFNIALPARRFDWRALLIGSALEMVLLRVLNDGFTWYAKFAVSSVGFYQTLGSLLVLMVYLNLLATILVVGQVLIAWLNDLFSYHRYDAVSVPAAAKRPSATVLRRHKY
jgi:membrane protein